ncbi:DUF4130 domain-containing protein [Ramlibacter sp. G-1-2-2]|uniref:DUF4130 domain-containing protein n=1 Tax=Ramlibacter agri TaxID=2728837 RepID=A0A848GV29_9BURK|nr:DUF4130 domain-containing protein [Ramlibacter agri]NML42486.1 DUF4130 domain-containing protein [Ramlibacter agri]
MNWQDEGSAMDVKLTGQTDLAGFRDEARQLLAHQVPPEDVSWVLDLQAAGGYCNGESTQPNRPRNVARAATAIVPASFTRLCEFVVLHRDGDRFALLYRLLWRLVHEPGLRNDASDTDMMQAQHMAHAVRRDIHKLKAHMRLRTMHDAQGREWQVGCHEPAHHVMEAVGPWFCKRLEAPRWALFTPDRSVRCDEGDLLYGPGVPAARMPAFDGPEEAWRECHERVFAGHDG